MDHRELRQGRPMSSPQQGDGDQRKQRIETGVDTEPAADSALEPSLFDDHYLRRPVAIPSVKIRTRGVDLTLDPSEAGIDDFPMGRNKDGKIQRPLNAFFVWARIHRPQMNMANPLASSQEICIQMGEVWGKLTEQQKLPYYELAFKLRIKHEKEFPDWEYKPSLQRRKRRSVGKPPTLLEPVHRGIQPAEGAMFIPAVMSNSATNTFNTLSTGVDEQRSSLITPLASTSAAPFTPPSGQFGQWSEGNPIFLPTNQEPVLVPVGGAQLPAAVHTEEEPGPSQHTAGLSEPSVSEDIWSSPTTSAPPIAPSPWQPSPTLFPFPSGDQWGTGCPFRPVPVFMPTYQEPALAEVGGATVVMPFWEDLHKLPLYCPPNLELFLSSAPDAGLPAPLPYLHPPAPFPHPGYPCAPPPPSGLADSQLDTPSLYSYLEGTVAAGSQCDASSGLRQLEQGAVISTQERARSLFCGSVTETEGSPMESVNNSTLLRFMNYGAEAEPGPAVQ